MLNTDTIVALASPSGGAIGMVRLSGPEAIAITARLFKPKNTKINLREAQANTLHYGILHTL